MAVQSTVVNTAASIKYKAGINANGNDVVKAKKFPNVKVTAAMMDSIVSRNIFNSAGGDLIAKYGAQVTEKTVTELEVR